MTGVIRLEPVLDMAATGRLAAVLAATPDPVTLDASQVRHVGGLAAQLLLSHHRGGRHGLTLTQPSADCTAALARLGIDTASLSRAPA